MFCKFSFVLTILAFFMFSAATVAALPVAGAPGSLLGRSYSISERASEDIAIVAREVIVDAPIEVIARDEPLTHGERLLRRLRFNRRQVLVERNPEAEAQEAPIRRSPQPEPQPQLNVIRLVAARSNSNSLH